MLWSLIKLSQVIIKESLEMSLENLHVDIGAERVNKFRINLGFWETAHLPLP